ncbi:hypothetical protein FRAAL6889 [Frankia alni ACN14a]|uniref:Uncharacterized protein n=1 Tax=Frankia alni (strain DSM 45986 / CECT 9034 / ACN14a) TaxID=326424 RepID=Q0RAJ7_FRAAA|nr:hypothetical protein FRAAL6889 [Frankia alni ACN14a]
MPLHAAPAFGSVTRWSRPEFPLPATVAAGGAVRRSSHPGRDDFFGLPLDRPGVRGITFASRR